MREWRKYYDWRTDYPNCSDRGQRAVCQLGDRGDLDERGPAQDAVRRGRQTGRPAFEPDQAARQVPSDHPGGHHPGRPAGRRLRGGKLRRPHRGPDPVPGGQRAPLGAALGGGLSDHPGADLFQHRLWRAGAQASGHEKDREPVAESVRHPVLHVQDLRPAGLFADGVHQRPAASAGHRPQPERGSGDRGRDQDDADGGQPAGHHRER